MVILRKYGVATTIPFSLFKVDGIDFESAATFATGDVTVMKDEGAEANITTLPTDEGQGYSLALSNTEMEAARIVVYLVDLTATKIWLDIKIVIETYGNASAQHAFDLDTALVTLAGVTHTGAVIPTVSALTVLPAIPTNWLTATGIAASALNGKGNWNIDKTGYTLTQTFPGNFADLSITASTGLTDITQVAADKSWSTTVRALTDKAGFSLAATGLDLIVSTATGAVEFAKATWDRILSGGTHNIMSSAGRRLRGLQDFGNYLGSIHIDTVNGTAGTVIDENGTIENPVLTLADALTLNVTLGYNSFEMRAGAILTPTSDLNSFILIGRLGSAWTLNLNTRAYSSALIMNAIVNGVGTAVTRPNFTACSFNNVTLDPFHGKKCDLNGTMIFSSAGDYTLASCHSGKAGSGTPIIDMGALVSNVNLTMPDYNRGIEIQNLNAVGTDEFSISGDGQIIYAASSSGTSNQGGDWKVTNLGTVVISADDNTTNLQLVLADTDELQIDWADGGRLDTILDAIPITPMRGTNDAALATVVTEARMSELDEGTAGKMANQVDLIKVVVDAVTATLGVAGAGLGDLGGMSNAMKAEVLTEVVKLLTTQMTESYAANGVAPTFAQAQFAIHQMLMQFGIAGTAYTVRRLDNSTTAFIVTLDDGTTPTDVKRI